MNSKCKILVTGGSGFLGRALCERLCKMGYSVRVLARNEGRLIKLKQWLPRIEAYAGDVSERFVVKQAMKDVEGVFHLAANKHVVESEKFVWECTRSNIIGSINILEESLISNVKFVLGISTDKAAQVTGVYGASKFIMERLFQQFQRLNSQTKYRIVRYGNVLYSTGSVLCKWKDAILNKKEVIVTEPEATRFFWSIDQAVDLIFNCLDNATNPNPFVPEMKAMSIGNLILAMFNEYTNKTYNTIEELPIKIIGLQPGENLHEKIKEDGKFSNEVEQYTIEEIKKLI